MTLHPLPASTRQMPDPERFTYPFCYRPHPLCVAAAGELRAYLDAQPQWAEELSAGKMMGVLVVRWQGERAFLAAFSGTLGGLTRQEYFVPPVFDLMSPGNHFQEEQAGISAINRRLVALQRERTDMRRQLRLDELRQERDSAMQAMRTRNEQARSQRQALRLSLTPGELASRTAEMVRESQHQKAELRRAGRQWDQRIREAEAPLAALAQEERTLTAERRQRSEALQDWLFGQYRLLNAEGQERSVGEIFAPAAPPSGSGDCCAPKLLQYAFAHGMSPLCMAEFWVGGSPADEVRLDGHFYPACHSRCLPLLTHMLGGLRVDENPLMADYQRVLDEFRVQYADGIIAIVRKPAGMLSVPGRDRLPSVLDLLRERFPMATGPIIVHRLDMHTSGLLVAALTTEAYQLLQRQFLQRRIEKAYVALLERPLPVGQEGDISLPLAPDLADRPRQRVDGEHGKPALTHYRVVGNERGHARVLLHPLTGRTHQLRVHCAHPQGLGDPIVGDPLYGHAGDRLMLHAQDLGLTHPTSGERMDFHWSLL